MDYEKFFHDGLLFSEADSAKLAAFVTKVCLALGATAGLGLAGYVAKDVAQSGGAQSRYGPIAIAAGFLVGAAAGTLACMSLKSKLLEFLGQFRDNEVDRAIAALTPALRNELREEAAAILRMAAPEQLSRERELVI